MNQLAPCNNNSSRLAIAILNHCNQFFLSFIRVIRGDRTNLNSLSQIGIIIL